MMNSLIPCAEYIFRMCHRTGLPPISIIGFGLRWVSSEIRVPSPPARTTAFTGSLRARCHAGLVWFGSASLVVVVGLEPSLLDEAVAAGRRVVGLDHLRDQLGQGDPGRPSQP